MASLLSLFDGSGCWPLAAELVGITPKYASEIEKFPIQVTTKNFPNMIHLGDVREVHGDQIDPVEVISAGSPCQDLSVAGKREGLKGERSGLFMECVRIIKEMRSATDGRYPYLFLWENVPGAFSSNGGEDFRAVIEELIRIIEPGYSVSRPPQGQWTSCGWVGSDSYSIAWRVLDAQFWGVPQRRKRIFLVCDFRTGGGKGVLMSKKSMTLSTLNEQILFESKAYKKTAHPRNSEEGQGWEETEVSDTLNTFDQTEKRASTKMVDAPIIAIEGNGCRPSHSGSGFSEDGVSYTLNSVELHGVYDGYRVRRLTPKECARLQGFPDDWCDGIKHGDSAEYKMWGNGMALPCALYVMEGVKEYLDGLDAEEV